MKQFIFCIAMVIALAAVLAVRQQVGRLDAPDQQGQRYHEGAVAQAFDLSWTLPNPEFTGNGYSLRPRHPMELASNATLDALSTGRWRRREGFPWWIRGRSWE